MFSFNNILTVHFLDNNNMADETKDSEVNIANKRNDDQKCLYNLNYY